MVERHLVWDGCFNVRDLGGHRTGDGRTTHFGAVVRSDAPDRLSDAGWAALESHGVRTIVDLRDPSELGGASVRWGNLALSVRRTAIWLMERPGLPRIACSSAALMGIPRG